MIVRTLRKTRHLHDFQIDNVGTSRGYPPSEMVTTVYD